MDLHPDFADLLQAFADEGVRYLLIGGYAVGFHSRPRFTKDIDLWIAHEPANVSRAVRALRRFGAPPQVYSGLATARPDEVVWMGSPPVRVDILQRIDGAAFEQAYPKRVMVEWGGMPVALIGIDELIEAKRAAGRPQDLQDVAVLERVRDRRKR